MGIPNYETLHLLHNEIKSNAMAVQSNLGGGKHGYLGLVVRPTAYDLLTNTTFFCKVNPGDLGIPIAATHHTQEELKLQYDENLRVFHKTQGVERALIQQLVLAVKARYITTTRNRTTGQFTSTLFILIKYMIVAYGKISPSQLIDLKQNTKTMQYYPQTPIDTVFNQVEDLLEYRELAKYLYTQIKTTNIAYRIINRTRNFQDAIKIWNRMNPFQQNWINFKTHFCTAYREIKETDELTMEDAGYHQANVVNNIVANMSGIKFTYPP